MEELYRWKLVGDKEDSYLYEENNNAITTNASDTSIYTTMADTMRKIDPVKELLIIARGRRKKSNNDMRTSKD